MDILTIGSLITLGGIYTNRVNQRKKKAEEQLIRDTERRTVYTLPKTQRLALNQNVYGNSNEHNLRREMEELTTKRIAKIHQQDKRLGKRGSSLIDSSFGLRGEEKPVDPLATARKVDPEERDRFLRPQHRGATTAVTNNNNNNNNTMRETFDDMYSQFTHDSIIDDSQPTIPLVPAYFHNSNASVGNDPSMSTFTHIPFNEKPYYTGSLNRRPFNMADKLNADRKLGLFTGSGTILERRKVEQFAFQDIGAQNPYQYVEKDALDFNRFAGPVQNVQNNDSMNGLLLGIPKMDKPIDTVTIDNLVRERQPKLENLKNDYRRELKLPKQPVNTGGQLLKPSGPESLGVGVKSHRPRLHTYLPEQTTIRGQLIGPKNSFPKRPTMFLNNEDQRNLIKDHYGLPQASQGSSSLPPWFEDARRTNTRESIVSEIEQNPNYASNPYGADRTLGTRLELPTTLKELNMTTSRKQLATLTEFTEFSRGLGEHTTDDIRAQHSLRGKEWKGFNEIENATPGPMVTAEDLGTRTRKMGGSLRTNSQVSSDQWVSLQRKQLGEDIDFVATSTEAVRGENGLHSRKLFHRHRTSVQQRPELSTFTPVPNFPTIPQTSLFLSTN